jgi:hypothetical protein
MHETERQAAADRLYAAVAGGHLSLDDFSDRIGAAYAATSSAELAPLVADLPADLPATTRSPGEASPAVVQRVPIGAIKRGGRWRLAADTELRTVLGPVKLDLHGAQVARPEVTLSVRTTVGTIKVWVPPGLRVVVEGDTRIGTRYVEENELPPEVPAPTLRLRLSTGIGTVKVYRR